jgi:hypothetical protein
MANLSESYLLTSQPQHAVPVASTSSSTVALLSQKTLALFSLKDNSTLATLDTLPDAIACCSRLLNDERWVAIAAEATISQSRTPVHRDGTFANTPKFAQAQVGT